MRTVWSKGKRSRNKASVGEPADGSLRFIAQHSHYIQCVCCRQYKPNQALVYVHIHPSNTPELEPATHRNTCVAHTQFDQKQMMSLKKLVERWISRLLASLKVAANCEMKVVWIARHTGPFSGCGTPHLLNEVVTRSLPCSSSDLLWLLQCTWLRTCCIITTFVLITISMPWIENYSFKHTQYERMETISYCHTDAYTLPPVYRAAVVWYMVNSVQQQELHRHTCIVYSKCFMQISHWITFCVWVGVPLTVVQHIA